MERSCLLVLAWFIRAELKMETSSRQVRQAGSKSSYLVLLSLWLLELSFLALFSLLLHVIINKRSKKISHHILSLFARTIIISDSSCALDPSGARLSLLSIPVGKTYKQAATSSYPFVLSDVCVQSSAQSEKKGKEKRKEIEPTDIRHFSYNCCDGGGWHWWLAGIQPALRSAARARAGTHSSSCISFTVPHWPKCLYIL